MHHMPVAGLFGSHNGPKLVMMLAVVLLPQMPAADLCPTSMCFSFAADYKEVLTGWTDWAEIYYNS